MDLGLLDGLVMQWCILEPRTDSGLQAFEKARTMDREASQSSHPPSTNVQYDDTARSASTPVMTATR